jgi:hypothetical protein
VWLRFADTNGDSELDKKNKSKYYVAKDATGAEYGLTSLHVLTKDTPNWFWANFHHVDNPTTPFEVKDTYGRPASLKGTVWDNYVLGGTQTDFVNAIGQPIALADWFIEFKFPASSCMNCHSQANASPDGSVGPTQIIGVGVPDPSVYMKDGHQYYLPTDFVWSMPFRARDERSAPPKRCVL